MSVQKSFMFYLSWEEQLSVLPSDEERWNFVHNLFRFHRGEKLEFKSDMVRLVWLGVKIAVEENRRKWNDRANNSRINGRKHTGNKNQVIEQITQRVLSEPKEPVKSEELNVNGEELRIKGKELTVKGEILNVNSEVSNENSKLVYVDTDDKNENIQTGILQDKNSEIKVPLLERLELIENWEELLVSMDSGKFIDTYEYQLDLDSKDKIDLINFLKDKIPNE